MITDISQYDSIRDSKSKRRLILSYDKEFKEKFLSLYPNDINVGFKEDSYNSITPELMRLYFQLFLKIIPDINYVCIDCNDYSIGYMFIQSATLDGPQIEEIQLYADDSINSMDFYLLKDSAGREKTYSRQQFLIS